MFIFLCLCAQAFALKSVLSPYQNNWDGEMRFSAGLITGMVSEHSNSREDRRWRFYYSDPIGFRCVKKEWSLTQNAFDRQLDFKCGSNQAMSGIWSYHNNHHEDRRWKFQCCALQGRTLYRERLTSDINDWDAQINFKCGSTEVLVGLKSRHSNKREDRIWQARCATLRGGGHVVNGIVGQYTTYYVNGWDGKLDYSVKKGYVFTGLASKHHNRREDRRFRIHYSRLNGIQCKDLGWSHFVNNWDGVMNYKCRPNSAMVGLRSWHSNRREDRRYQVRCCDLSNGGKYTIASYMTGYVNAYDGEMNRRCGGNDVLVGLYSHHNNRREDRRFKFYCGRIIKG